MEAGRGRSFAPERRAVVGRAVLPRPQRRAGRLGGAGGVAGEQLEVAVPELRPRSPIGGQGFRVKVLVTGGQVWSQGGRPISAMALHSVIAHRELLQLACSMSVV